MTNRAGDRVSKPAENITADSLFAVFDKLPFSLLEGLFDNAELDRLERSGILTVSADGEVSAELPDSTRGVTSVQRRRVARQVAAILKDTGLGDVAPTVASRIGGELHRADIYVRSVVSRATRARLLLGDIEGAESIARFGLAHDSDDLELAHLLSMSLEARGGHGAATAVAGTSRLDDTSWWGRWASNLFISTGHRPPVPASVEDADKTKEIVANRAWIDALNGDVRAVAATISEVLDDSASSAQAVVWACVAGAVPAALDGNPTVVRHLIEHARSILRSGVSELTPFADLQIELVDYLSMVRIGELRQATTRARDRLRLEESLFVKAVWSCFAGIGARESGQYPQGLQLFDEGLPSFDGNPFGLITWAQSERAVCAVMSGADDHQSISPADANGLYRSCLHRNESWRLAAAGHIDSALEASIEAARVAEHLGQNAHQILALVDLARFGQPRLARTMLTQLTELRSPLIRVGADAVMALAGDDPDALIAAAETARAMQIEPLATELFHRARILGLRSGRYELAARIELCCPSALLPTPLLRDSADVASTITDREREIGHIAATGIPSNKIAERLGVSVRTVDNMLGRIYSKCGFDGRGAIRLQVKRWGTEIHLQ